MSGARANILPAPTQMAARMFNVEALGQAPTRYVFRLDPIVVDGVQYSSREYAQLTLPPGATTADPVKLVVQALRGQIAVTVTAPNRMFKSTYRSCHPSAEWARTFCKNGQRSSQIEQSVRGQTPDRG